MEKLQFLLTKDGFCVDDILYAEKETRALAGDFARAQYEALYELAFREQPECFDAAVKRRRFEKAFQGPVGAEVLETLREELFPAGT